MIDEVKKNELLALKFDMAELQSLELAEIRGGKLDLSFNGLKCTVNNVAGCGCSMQKTEK